MTSFGLASGVFLFNPVEAFEKERNDMISTLVTKEDLCMQLSLMESRMTVKLGAMLFTAVGLAVALFKVL